MKTKSHNPLTAYMWYSLESIQDNPRMLKHSCYLKFFTIHLDTNYTT